MLDFLRKKPAQADHNFVAAGSSESMGSSVDLSTFNKVINFCLYALIFLTPLLFLPITSEAREFNKQALVFFMTVLMLGVWMIKIMTTRHVSWVKTPLDFVLLGYLAVYFIASLISIDRVSSFLGYYGRFTGSFAMVLSLIVLYFLVVNNLKNERTMQKVVKYLTWGMGFVLVYSLLQLFGWHVLPWAFTKSASFNPIGTMVALGIFSALCVVFIQWRLYAEQTKNMLSSLVYWILTVVGLLIILLVNSFIVWVVLTLAMIVFLALTMAMVKDGGQGSTMWFWKPMLILVIGVLFIAFNFLPSSLNPRNLINLSLPVEIQLSNSTAWNLAGNSMKSGPKTAILGSGPGTTGIAFGDIKPESLNKTIVWQLTFDRSSNEITGIIIETGILGLLAFELAAMLFLVYALMYLVKQSSQSGWKYALGFFLIWFALYVTHFFYFYSAALVFMYWISIALFMAAAHLTNREQEDRTLSMASSSRATLSWMFVSILALAILLVGGFFQAAVYVAETSYTSGLKQLNQPNPNFAQVSSDFGRAVTLNPYRDNYILAFAQNLIFRASEEAAKSEPNIPQIQRWLADIINLGKRATEISPAKASNWSALAQFYTGIRTLISGTDTFIIDSWNKAIERDPKNPSLYVRLAQAYSNAAEIIDATIVGSGPDADQDGLADAKEQQLGSNPNNSDTNQNGVTDGDEVKAGFNPAGTGRLSTAALNQFIRVDQAMLKQAEDNLLKAIELKPDLPDSYIALARVLERSNKLSEAKAKLDEAAKQFPNNPDVLFEQGRIAFNQANQIEAEKIFLKILTLAPNHANTHYSLGLLYRQRGDLAKALAEFEKTREISGPNVDLEKLINTIKEQLQAAPQQ